VTVFSLLALEGRRVYHTAVPASVMPLLHP